MKITTRENFRVQISGQIVTGHLRHASADLVGMVNRIDLTGTVYPRRIGDFGIVSISDSMAMRGRDTAPEYERRCKEIAWQIRDRYGSQVKTEILCDGTDSCSFCGRPWEVLSAEDIDAYPEFIEQPGDGPGLPVCCNAAQDEWRAAQTAVTT